MPDYGQRKAPRAALPPRWFHETGQFWLSAWLQGRYAERTHRGELLLRRPPPSRARPLARADDRRPTSRKPAASLDKIAPHCVLSVDDELDPPHFVGASAQHVRHAQLMRLAHSPRLQTFTANAVAKFGFLLQHQHARSAF